MDAWRIAKQARSIITLATIVAIATLCIPAKSQAELQCYDCHGTKATADPRPVDASDRDPVTGGFRGNHRTHMGEGSTAAACGRCHPGSEGYAPGHRDGQITLSSRLNASPLATTYNNRTSAFPQTATPSPGSCTNVNCHFESTTPEWGSTPLVAPGNCNTCHGTPPADGSHPALDGSGKKHADYYGIASSCDRCHSNHQTFSHATSAGRRGLDLSFATSPNSGGTYSGATGYPDYLPSSRSARDGSCTNLYCHSNGNDGAANVAPAWGGTLPADCSGCHDRGGAATGLSGRHGKHTDAAGYAFACERCHRDTVTGNDTVANRSLHVNKVKDVAFREGGTYDESKRCTNTYCHSNAAGGAPMLPVKWTDTGVTMKCISCHKGRTVDSNQADCAAILGVWSSARGYCTPSLTMSSNGHERLVGLRWIRKYPCSYCHYATVNALTEEGGRIVGDGDVNTAMHLNGTKNVVIAPQWNIVGKDPARYEPVSKKCENVYCHSDGTTNPDSVRSFGWLDGRTKCNTCHGHLQGGCSSSGCHDGHVDSTGKTWAIKTGWPLGEEWKEAIPMFPNQGPGTARANSHMRHAQSDYTCDQCHAATIKASNGTTTCIGPGCHKPGSVLPTGGMSEASHLDPKYHSNKYKEVVFRFNPDGSKGSYDDRTKTCTNTSCHTGGTDPQWGGSVNSAVTCLSCHGTTLADVDSFRFVLYSTQAKINMTEWVTTGHGRPASAGPYPASGNPAANFPGNPCWYCHDNAVLHNYTSNPFRLRQHQQFSNRFDRECVYCHMVGLDSECRSCHQSGESMAPQLARLTADSAATWPDGTIPSYNGVPGRPDHTVYVGSSTSCLTSDCHYLDPANPKNDLKLHNAGAGLWDTAQQADVRNQYVMMGVCLKCHDDDTGGKCTSCHTPLATNPYKYDIGFRPYSGAPLIKPQKARASSVHFGYKHNRAYLQDKVWKGGKFCWDCHDPHGDGNIYMIQSRVATTTDGKYGIPKTRSEVVFTKKQSGLDYARISAPYNGICNVCHAPQAAKLSKHFGSDYGDGHNASRVCTNCHEHRFTDSHADDQPCNTCHMNKPVPRHSAFGQPRDCTKCHAGTVGKRMDIMGQMNANSHHVQGVTATNKHCYACHWEATPEGLIDVRYHEGYNYKTYTSVKNATVDLVVWKAGVRPTYYNTTTAVQFLASRIGTANERSEAAKLTNVCISCHSDQNNDSQPFGDCRTPNQYAWDRQSVDARYSQKGTTAWGKYNSTTYPNVTKKDTVAKALSAHGNAVNNAGGFDPATGLDGSIPNTRSGSQNVQCFDCHSSHGSNAAGITTSYVTFNGTRNGGNLKETQAGKGGYSMDYKAAANSTADALNPYSTGAGQCFDCHLTETAGVKPWGYKSTFGANSPIKGYMDSDRFGQTPPAYMQRYTYKTMPVKGGHLKASFALSTSARGAINGLCTPCHDPHGVSPTLGNDQAYAVPMLKGTWMTSPYKEDRAEPVTTNPPNQSSRSSNFAYNTDDTTFGGSARITEDESRFAGLCLRCHGKETLTNGTDHTWKSKNRVHEAVKGWKTANATTQHSYTCSKCHLPHVSALPRLMQTNCLDFNHRGNIPSGGQAGSGIGLFPYSNGPRTGSFPRGMGSSGVNCHPNGTWPDNSWNRVTPW